MKALSMLDHVMLWMARVFAIVCLYEILRVVSFSIQSDLRLSRDLAMMNRDASWSLRQYIEPACLVTMALLWNASLWMLGSFVLRAYLSLSAVAVLAFLICSSFSDSRSGFTVFNAIWFLGFISMIWVGLSAPGRLGIKALSSSRSEFSNPVNLVNPV